MRAKAQADGLSVQAIAGTDVVLLGMDLDEVSSKKLQGFAIHRTDHREGEAAWLSNQLRFEVVEEKTPKDWTSLANPIQTFRWGDYSAKPGHTYTYRVLAMGGEPGALRSLAEASVKLTTENPATMRHGVFFNRGAMASQWYATRFGNKQPADVPNREAYKWLSRGLEEELLAFIGRADGPEWTINAALYETTYAPALEAFRIAADAGAEVHLVVDTVGKPAHDPRSYNEPALAAAGLTPLVTPRTHTKIAHNKFIVLSRHGVPEAVWTGSTNLTEGGIFGQSNVGHLCRLRTVAGKYLDYWKQLADDPMPKTLEAWNDLTPPVPKARPRRGTTPVFSSRGSLGALEWYAKLAETATSGVFLTAAFGVSPQLMTVFTQERDYLRYVLLDTDSGAQLTIRNADPDNQVAVGAPIGTGGWGQWVKETTLAANKHVRYVHTKYMLIDPLGEDPIVITGSANFSQASTTDNDENMLVVRGDHALADVYLTEFMRLFTHYEFRAATKTPANSMAPGPELAMAGARTKATRKFLRTDPADWVPRWYEDGSSRAKERQMFAGTLPA